jgi:hypothetical protein
VPLNIKILGFALTNGTLGSFTVSIKGTLVAGAGGAWQASGPMSFYDKFDFDPRAFAAGGRSFQGEIKTMVGHYMIPGDDYEVTSVDTTFRQSEADDTIVWAGGTPKPVLDRVATADMKMIDE